MKTLILLLTGVIIAAGCAKVQVEAPKEPIKVDISMRLDVYQHVEKDIDEIESIVSGEAVEPQSKLNLDFFISEAHAAEGLSPEVEQAALRRRDRHAQLVSWEVKGVVGENKSGLVEVRIAEQADASVRALVAAENSDRMVIYKGVAQKNGTTVGEVQKLYAKRLQADAPGGTPVEDVSGAGGWRTK